MARVIVLILSGMLAACVSAQPITMPQNLEPIPVNDRETAPVAFYRLLVRIPSGRKVGYHHAGLLKIRQYAHVWNSSITVASDEFKLLASETMRNQGYNVLGAENLLFGKDESAKATYQLGGTVTDLTFNTFAPLAGGYSEAKITVEWQVFNTLQRQVVFQDTTEGYAKGEGTEAQPVQAAFVNALTNLLGNPRFVELLTVDAVASSTSAVPKITAKVCDASAVSELPGDIEEAFEAVFVIRAGSTTGSGVIVSPDGHALTAAHVVSGLDEVTVRLRSGLELSAQVLVSDPAQDIALIELAGSGHACARAVDSPPPIGADLFAVGAPSGQQLAFSVSRGVVSGFREFDHAVYIQTDASLNPGNSGGPLFDSSGRLVGIVSWKISAPGFEGLAFGVPFAAAQTAVGLTWKK